MPIRPELRKFYGREWHEAIRPRILARAGDRCEQCRAPNGVKVRRYRGLWVDPDQLAWRSERGRRLSAKEPRPSYSQCRTVRIILQVAHLNHQPGDDRPENLRALCSWCHLHYDKQVNRETIIDRRDARRTLLVEASCAAC